MMHVTSVLHVIHCILYGSGYAVYVLWAQLHGIVCVQPGKAYDTRYMVYLECVMRFVVSYMTRCILDMVHGKRHMTPDVCMSYMRYGRWYTICCVMCGVDLRSVVYDGWYKTDHITGSPYHYPLRRSMKPHLWCMAHYT